MSEPEGFLSRWSRKKRAAEKDESKAVEDQSLHPRESGDTPSARPRESGDPEARSMDSRLHGDERQQPESSPETAIAGGKKSDSESEIDLSKLPSLDEITADTDIRPFLARGVPVSLRQAALRRLWVADPKIRDFIGIAENQWDFTAQGATPGFDLASPTGDVARMVADMFGPKAADESASEEQREKTQDSSAAAAPTDDRAPPDHISVNEERGARGTANTKAALPMVRRTEVADTASSSAAPQQDAAPREDSQPTVRRSHGGAMPK
jgi:hypothetical protein